MDAVIKHKIPFKEVSGGDELLLRCADLAKAVPSMKVNEECAASKDAKCYVNKATGLFFCHKCRASGAVGAQGSTVSRQQDATPTKATRFTPEFIAAMSTSLFLPIGEKALVYLKSRGFTEDTIKATRLGYHPHQNAIAIPNFDVSGEALSVKYRFIDPDAAGMRYSQESLGGQGQLPYGLATLPGPREGTLHITESELDAISLKQIDPDANVIGLPGMNAFPQDKRKDDSGILDYLKDYDKVFLYPDNEIRARLAFTKHAAVLGRSRCFLVSLPDKDVNDSLKRGMTVTELRNLQRTATNTEGDPYMGYSDLRKSLVGLLQTESAVAKRSTGFPTLDRYMAFIRPGELTILAGAGGGGKSTLAFNIVYNLLKQQTPVLLGSFEMAPKTAAIPRILSLHHKRNLLAEALAQGTRMQWEPYLDAPPLKYLGLLLPDSFTVNVAAVGAALESVYAEKHMEKHDIVFLMLDHYHRMARPGPDIKGADTATFHEQQISAIKNFTRQFPNLHILLLTQLTKKGQADRFSKDMLRGSVALSQESDAILMLNTDKSKTVLTCEKVRSVAGVQGWGAEVTLQYNPTTTEVAEVDDNEEEEY